MIYTQNIKVVDVKKLKNSFMGNPNYEFYFETGEVMRTPSNVGWAYSFSTHTFIDKKVDISYWLTRDEFGKTKSILDKIKNVEQKMSAIKNVSPYIIKEECKI